jgi:hypothetical protein
MTPADLTKLRTALTEALEALPKEAKPTPNYEGWHKEFGRKYRQYGDKVLKAFSSGEIKECSLTVAEYRNEVDTGTLLPCDPPSLPDGDWTYFQDRDHGRYRVVGKTVTFITSAGRDVGNNGQTWNGLNLAYVDGRLFRATWKPPAKPKWVLREYPARNNRTGYCVDRGAYDKGQTIYGGSEFALSKQQAEAIAKAMNELEDGK